MTRAKGRKRWQVLLTDYYDSDLSTREWCEGNGVTDHQLRYWRRKIGEAQPSASWAYVDLVDDGITDATNLLMSPKDSKSTATREGGVCLRVGAACIEVQPGFDSGLLSGVLRVAVATC